jgi:acetyl-CoA synthetase
MDLISPVVKKWVQEAKEDPEAFWGRAAEQLPWLRKWDRVFEWTPPTFRWFIGGQTNLAYNALDHHGKHGWGGHTALVYLSERGERRLFTYAQLLHEVERLAAALRGMGIQKGDRITIYMPTCPEAIMLMLAATGIGAIHIVVFAGFGRPRAGERLAARLCFRYHVSQRQGRTTQRDRGRGH